VVQKEYPCQNVGYITQYSGERRKAGKPVWVVVICTGCCLVTAGMCLRFSYMEGEDGIRIVQKWHQKLITFLSLSTFEYTVDSIFNRGSYCGTYPTLKGTISGTSHVGLLHVCTLSTASCSKTEA